MNAIFTKLEKLQKKHVPSMGKAKTVYGEILRAYARLAYRFYNDGDVFYKDYGVDTCGSSLLYLSHELSTWSDPKLYRAIFKWEKEGPIYDDEKRYEKMLIEVGKLLYDFLISEEGEQLKSIRNNVDSRAVYYRSALKKWDDYDDEDEYDKDKDNDEDEY